jgi:hypothetical protein
MSYKNSSLKVIEIISTVEENEEDVYSMDEIMEETGIDLSEVNYYAENDSVYWEYRGYGAD